MSDYEEVMETARFNMHRAANHVDRCIEAVQEAHASGDARAQGRVEQEAHKAIRDLDFAVSYLGHLRIRESERTKESA